MKFSVYYDEKLPEFWISREESILIKDYCEKRGATVVDSQGLLNWLKKETGVLALAHDLVPEESLQLFKEFMERGGIVVWVGDIPFRRVFNKEAKVIGEEGGLKVLGFYPVTDWRIDVTTPTPEGSKLGLVPYVSYRSVDPKLVDVVLAVNSGNSASSWIKKIGNGMFIRLLDKTSPLKGIGFLVYNVFLETLLEEKGVDFKPIEWVSKVKEKFRDLIRKERALAFEIVFSTAFEAKEGIDETVKAFIEERDSESILKRVANWIRGRVSLGEVYWIGQSHIDWAWLWPWEDTVEKCRFTFSQALKHMEKYPDYKYTQSSAAFYEWMERYYPEIFEEIRKRIKEGRWGLVGGSWTEHDCNVPSGESMVRQRLYGQRYYLSRFGRIADVEWMVDTFGFTWTLPQILVKSGQKYMFTTKLDWSYVNKLPFRIFLWESPDGSRVIAYQGRFTPGYYPSSSAYREFASRTPLVKGVYDYVNLPEVKAKEHVKEMGVIYGAGDGGGGPTPLEVAAVREITKWFPENKQVTGEEYMRLLGKYWDRLPVWRDELYLENHRGTYTAQWIIKALNREAECLLVTAEKAATIAYLNGMNYPGKDIEEAWKWVLSYQWHDPLPGSAIKEVYEEAKRDFNTHVFPTTKRILEDSVKHLTKPGEKGLVLFNPLSWEREDIVEVEYEGFIPEEETQLTLDGKIVFKTKLPPIGFKTLDLKIGEPGKPSIKVVDNKAVLETDFYKVVVDKDGVVSLYDKTLKKEFLKDKITIVSYFCRPAHWSNWNIMPGYWEHERGRFKARRIIQVEGPVYVSAILEGEIEESPATWEIRVYRKLKRIDLLLTIDWRTVERIVKMLFPVNLKPEFAYASIPFGVYPRPYKPRTRFEKEKWEFPHQKWVCISDGEYSLNIANWPIHGSSIINGVYGLTLIKSGNRPDPYCDLYLHYYKISLNTFKGDWKQGLPWRLGDEINYPIYTQYVDGKIGEYSLLNVKPGNVVVEAVKKHEDSNDIIVRVYDASGEGGTVTLNFNKKVLKAVEMDFIELNEIKELDVKDKTVSFKLKPWEIKTIKVTFSQ